MERHTRSGRGDKVARYEKDLETPLFPMALLYLWTAFHRMRRRKGSGANGLDPIEWPDIDAFTRLSGARLVPWEIETIERLDDLFLNEVSKARSVS